MINIFISYRRVDGAHAAQRVRTCMQAKFGKDAVFIDREIPPGADWGKYLRDRLKESTDVVVLVGDAFLRELRRGRPGNAPPNSTDEQDWLKTEIETSLQLGKTIYPVLIGGLEMPAREELPESIQKFANAQAVYAREPAFDAAMAVLMRAIAARHGWVELTPETSTASSSVRLGGPVGRAAMLLLMALLLTGLAGQLLQWLATGTLAAGAPVLWPGVLYLLCTLLWGLGPYLVYRSVAEVRARAQLPVFSWHGFVTMANVVLTLIAGGSFLLLSTQANFVLRLPGLLPDQPMHIDYVFQGAALLAVVGAGVVAAMLEPSIRGWDLSPRRRGLAMLMGFALLVHAAEWWLVKAIAISVPALLTLPAVSIVGYFMLAPALNFLILSWDFACSKLGLSGQAWHSRSLFALAIGLYLACTLGYFAHGPVRLFLPDFGRA